MEFNDELVKLITQEVMKAINENGSEENSNFVSSADNNINSLNTVSSSNSKSGRLIIEEVGEAQEGVSADEVVLGLAPAFGVSQTETIAGLSHYDVLREIAAGVEEEGMRIRFIKVYSTSDVSFISLTAAKLSGSGIGMGIQSKGTMVMHHKDMYPLTNLELFPQAPLITLETYRKIGKNAARYAKGQTPTPITVQNDFMVRPKFQAKAAILHIKETEKVVDKKKPVQLNVRFEGR